MTDLRTPHSQEGPEPDPRFLGCDPGLVLTKANDMAFVVSVGWDGACDMQANIDKPQMAAILRQIAAQLDPEVDGRD